MAVIKVRVYKCLRCGEITRVTHQDVNRSVRCKKCNSNQLWLKDKYYENEEK